MNTDNLITLLREEIENVCKCYSPDLPQNDELCCSLSLGQGNNQRAINKSIIYSDIPCYLLIRGSSNDKETRKLADSVFNLLDMRTDLVSDKLHIILVQCDTPNYAFRDENQRIHYNINFYVKVEWRNE